MKYPAMFEPAEEGGFVVVFRDIPEAITQGDDRIEAISAAQDALITAIEFYFEDKRAVPYPSAVAEGEESIELPPDVASKVFLLNEMLSQHLAH
jgi:antitoxin HicB